MTLRTNTPKQNNINIQYTVAFSSAFTPLTIKTITDTNDKRASNDSY